MVSRLIAGVALAFTSSGEQIAVAALYLSAQWWMHRTREIPATRRLRLTTDLGLAVSVILLPATVFQYSAVLCLLLHPWLHSGRGIRLLYSLVLMLLLAGAAYRHQNLPDLLGLLPLAALTGIFAYAWRTCQAALLREFAADPTTGLRGIGELTKAVNFFQPYMKRNGNAAAFLVIRASLDPTLPRRITKTVQRLIDSEIAKILNGRIRACDIPCRYKLHHFGLFLPDATATGAEKLAHDLALDFQKRLDVISIQCQLNFAVTPLPSYPVATECILEGCETAMTQRLKPGLNPTTRLIHVQPDVYAVGTIHDT